MTQRRGLRARRSAPSLIFQREAPSNWWIQRRAADATLRLPSHNFVAVRRNAAPEANSNANANARTRTQRHLSRLASGQLVVDHAREATRASLTVHPHPSMAPDAIGLARIAAKSQTE